MLNSLVKMKYNENFHWFLPFSDFLQSVFVQRNEQLSFEVQNNKPLGIT